MSRLLPDYPVNLYLVMVRIWLFSLLSILVGLGLWLSGVDAQLTQFLEVYDHPISNKIWRLIGQIGLGRWQMLFCLLAVLWVSGVSYKYYPSSFVKLLGGAVWVWVRGLVFNFAPVEGNRFFFQRSARYAQQLPYLARVWFYSIPIMFLAGAITAVLKILVGRSRPKMLLWHDVNTAIGPTLEAVYHSFPSGHTTTTFALLAVLVRAYPKYTVLLWVGACLTGFARVGAITPHFLGDVAAGAGIGYGVGVYLFHKYRLNR